MSSFQVKCYLIKNVESIQDPIEIKRFNICSQQDSLLYDSLIDAIKRYFEKSFKSDNDIKTYWLDDEADLIRFSTNIEFLDLISSFNGNLLKIYVQQEKAEKESSCHKDFGEVFSLLNNPQIISNVSELIGSVFGNMEKPKEEFNLSEKEIDERVQVGVENLIRMGFSNDNECLTKLLRDCKGNINPVLDIFKAQWI
jgi:hypothetical protein